VKHRKCRLTLSKTKSSKKKAADALAFNASKLWLGKSKLIVGKVKKDPTEDAVSLEKAPLVVNELEIQNPTVSPVEEEEPFWLQLVKALGTSILGAILVAFFSDPMVDIITHLGDNLGIQAFYISFVVTPFCSNASELIASLMFSANKSITSSSMTYSQLYGAATMNNTMGLGIFYALIYFRQLSWEFSAETMSILFVIWVMCSIASVKTTFKPYWIFFNVLLYPASLGLVYILEKYAHWR